MSSALSDLPTATQSAVICATCVALAILGAIFFRPVARAFVRRQMRLNEILGNFLAVFGVLYGILLGLLAVAAYEKKITIEEGIQSEGTTLFTLFRNVGGLPEPHRSELRRAIAEYNDFVIAEEWPQMRVGKHAQGGRPYVDRIQDLLLAYEPRRTGEEILMTEAMSGFQSFLQQRALRLYRALGHLPGIMWWVVLLGAVINLVLLWMFDMRLGVQLILSTTFAFYLGAVISLIVIMDSPLRGEYGISPEVFQLLKQFMAQAMSRG